MVRVFRFIATTTLAFVLGYFAVCSADVLADDDVTEAEVLEAVETLQPAHPPAVAASWAGIFFEAGRETGIDPLLLVAIGFRESSLRGAVEGALGELGAMQLHGIATLHRPRGCDLQDIGCNVRGGAAYLQFCRAHCNDERWSVWVGAYGMSRCPTIDEAEASRSVRRARNIYEQIGGEGWQ